jgi:integrase
MKRQKIFILPKLQDCGGDLKKQWYVYFTYCNPATNKMERFRLYSGFTQCKTKKEKKAHAKKVIEDYTYRLKSGWNPFKDDISAVYTDNLEYDAASRVFRAARSGNRTFNYYSNLFLPEIEGMAEKTYKNYISKYRTFDAWLTKKGYSENDICFISPDIMRGFFLYLINDEKLARITVMKYRHMLERFFDWCVKKKYLLRSPMEDLPDTTRENDQAPRPIHESDIDRLVQKIKETDPQLWLTVQLEYYCFLRPGQEIRLARISWFDIARGIITVPKQLVKTRQEKFVIIPVQFREYLMNEWKIHLFPPDYYLIGQNGMPGTKPLGSNNLRNRFNIIRDSLNLPKVYKLYSWKHTGNARAADAGIPAYHRQKQNGHSSMGSFEDYLKNKIGFTSKELENQFPSL